MRWKLIKKWFFLKKIKKIKKIKIQIYFPHLKINYINPIIIIKIVNNFKLLNYNIKKD